MCYVHEAGRYAEHPAGGANVRPEILIVAGITGLALAGCNQMTTANYRGDKADWSRTSSKTPIEVAACVSDAWGQESARFKSLPNAKGQTLVLEGGPPEIPVVDAVVDIETAGKGSSVRYGGRLRGIALPWVERSVEACV